MITRRTLLAATAATVSVAAQAASPTLPFLVIGDWGRQGHDTQREVGITLGAAAETARSRFTISVGDNFYEDGVASIQDPQWSDSFEQVYTAAALQTPWRVILGNHDYRGSVEAQLQYPGARWSLPARYYTRTESLDDGTTAAFFYIDTSPFVTAYRGTKVRIEGQDTAVQLRWLERELAASTAAWRIVIGHHPVYLATTRFDTAELIGQLAPLLQRYKVQAYLCGHIHNMQQVEVDGTCFVTSGAGSRVQRLRSVERAGFSAENHGFVLGRLARDTLSIDFIDVSGTTLNQTRLRRA